MKHFLLQLAAVAAVVFLLKATLRESTADAPSGTAWMSSDLTSCDNPWERPKRRHPGEYLRENGIHTQGMAVTGEPMLSCQGCSCPTGQALNILIPHAEIGRARELGFQHAEKAPSEGQALHGWPN